LIGFAYGTSASGCLCLFPEAARTVDGFLYMTDQSILEWKEVKDLGKQLLNWQLAAVVLNFMNNNDSMQGMNAASQYHDWVFLLFREVAIETQHADLSCLLEGYVQGARGPNYHYGYESISLSLSLSLSLSALGFDACLHKNKLKWREAYNKISSMGAQYVALQIGWSKFKTCQFGSAKLFWPKMLRLVKDTAKPNTCC
jgi:hypothetical protein